MSDRSSDGQLGKGIDRTVARKVEMERGEAQGVSRGRKEGEAGRKELD